MGSSFKPQANTWEVGHRITLNSYIKCLKKPENSEKYFESTCFWFKVYGVGSLENRNGEPEKKTD